MLTRERPTCTWEQLWQAWQGPAGEVGHALLQAMHTFEVDDLGETPPWEGNRRPVLERLAWWPTPALQARLEARARAGDTSEAGFVLLDNGTLARGHSDTLHLLAACGADRERLAAVWLASALHHRLGRRNRLPERMRGEPYWLLEACQRAVETQLRAWGLSTWHFAVTETVPHAPFLYWPFHDVFAPPVLPEDVVAMAALEALAGRALYTPVRLVRRGAGLAAPQ